MTPEQAQNSVPLTLENFRPIIAEESTKKLVVVYFWAPWDEPSVAQLSVIQDFVSTYPDAMLLATVNCDEQQEIVGQFGVRGLPTTMLIKDGQPVDGFAGPQDTAQLQQTFANYLPKPEQELLVQAQACIAQDDYQQAFTLLKQAYDITQTDPIITVSFADACVETGNIEQAKSLIESLGLAEQHTCTAEYNAVKGKIELAEKAAESPELLELQAKHEANPDDLDIKMELAIALLQAHKAEQALALMFSVVKVDINFGDAKKNMLDMINALPDGDTLKSQYRRKLYSLLY